MNDDDVAKLRESHQLIWDALKSGMPEVKVATEKLYANPEMTDSVSDDVWAMSSAYIEMMKVVVSQQIQIGLVLSSTKPGDENASSR